MTEGEFITK